MRVGLACSPPAPARSNDTWGRAAGVNRLFDGGGFLAHESVPRAPWRLLSLMGLAVATFLASLGVGLMVQMRSAAGQGTSSPPQRTILGKVPPFVLRERSGRTVTLRDLHGKPWVAGFTFTRCRHTCPTIIGQMARLRSELPPAVQLVNISVDPAHDQPEVLARYAADYAADADSWWFLTGDPQDVEALLTDGFRISARQNPDFERGEGERILHSSRLVLVDRDGTIRGYYDGMDPLQITQLRRDAIALAGP